MRLLLIRWHPSLSVGGLAVNAECLTRELLRRGHEIAELTARFPALTRPVVERVVGAVAAGVPARPEVSHGLARYRAIVPGAALAGVVSSFAPDAVVVSSGGAWRRDWAGAMLHAVRGLPSVLYVYDAASVELAVAVEGSAEIVAISEYVAAPLRERGIDVTVVPPVIDRAAYQVDGVRRTALFVNPTEAKGVDVALALAAARPDVEFEFVGGPRRRAGRPSALANVTYRPWTADPRELFGQARLLLVPSPYPEAWPRVVGEAQASGIPALGADVGGVAEAVGEGGLLVESGASLSAWTDAFGALWDDPAAYAARATAAARAGERPALRPEVGVERLEAVVERAVAAVD